jgi:D-alanine-D-alanine ligase
MTMGTDTARTAEPRVLVLAGGLSHEREVSLKSGRRVLDALRSAGIDASLRDVDAGLLPVLANDPPDAVIIALHGSPGEDGSLQGVLDLYDIPYIGGDASRARLAWDKPTAKAVLRDAGIATPVWVSLPQERFSELGARAVLDRLVERFGLPLMVKPAQGGSGLGASVVREASTLPTAMVSCFAYHPTALVEPYLDGMDVAVGVVDLGDGPTALPAVEIVARDGVYDYAARYTAGLTTWHAPARLDSATADRVARVALAAHRALALGDMSRIDLIVAPDGTPSVLEASVAPGMTDTSLLPMAISAAGLDLGKTLATLVTLAVQRRGGV